VDTIVPVTSEDVRRLARGTGLPPDQIVAFYQGDELDDGGDGLHFAELDIGPRFLGLRRRWSDEREEETCRFFRGDRCTAYADRPLTCRLWPFSLGFDAQGRVNRLGINHAVECRYTLEGEVELPALERDWQRDERQDERWERQVAGWNRRHRGGTRRQFLSYVGLR
jgi:Fe-S-cluster containining protein